MGSRSRRSQEKMPSTSVSETVPQTPAHRCAPLKASGLRLNAHLASVYIRCWLDEVANACVHAATKAVSAARMAADRAVVFAAHALNAPVETSQHERIAEQLKFVQLGSGWQTLAQDSARDGASFVDFLKKVLASEQVAYERKRTVLKRLRRCRPAIRSSNSIWPKPGGALKAQTVDLGRLNLERAETSVMVGSCGIGKTHISVAH